jgi:uncharacterized membrane protein
MKNIYFTILISITVLSCNSDKRWNNEQNNNLEYKVENIVTDTTEEIISKNNNENINNIEASTYRVKFYDYHNDKEIDTFVKIDYLSEFSHLIIDFNYPKFINHNINEQRLKLYNDSIEILIESEIFDTSKHELKFNNQGNYKYLEQIDGKIFWGTDGEIPKEKISKIQINYSGEIISIPNELFNDLFEPNLECVNTNNDEYCYSKAYLTEKNELILIMLNSDGAGAYIVIFFIKDKKYVYRILGYC